jgi:hypothetical protein
MEHIESTHNESDIKPVSQDECIELKNIKYKTMLLSGAPLKETKNTDNLSNLDKFLEDEKNFNKAEPWCKLDKTEKIKKIMEFTEKYKKDNNLDEEETKKLLSFLKDSIDRKKLQRVKDVVYDKVTGLIKDIPSLVYTKSNKHFTLKNIDKRVSTIKSLTPKKNTNSVRGTIKKKEVINNKNNESSSDESD